MTTIISERTLAARVDALPWDDLSDQLDSRGFAVTEPLLSAEECAGLADLFDGGRFRSTVDMARSEAGVDYEGGQFVLVEPTASACATG